MAKYMMTGNPGTASVAAACAGMGKVVQGTTAVVVKLLGFTLGPQSNSADNTYGVQLLRASTHGAWTGVTPSPTDASFRASAASGGITATSAGTAGAELWRGGYHMRAGLQIVPIPGAEWFCTVTTCNSLTLQTVTLAQGTDIMALSMTFEE